MFKIGETYEFAFLEADDHGTYHRNREVWTVQDVEGNLLHLHVEAPENTLYGKIEARTKIVNLASPLFAEATPYIDPIKTMAQAMADRP